MRWYEAQQKNVPSAELPRVSWEKIVDHIDHAVKLVGPTHVGLGSDFDGTTVPDGMEDVSKLPKITAALLAKGYSEQDVKNILGENILRLLEQVEGVGRQLRAAASKSDIKNSMTCSARLVAPTFTAAAAAR